MEITVKYENIGFKVIENWDEVPDKILDCAENEGCVNEKMVPMVLSQPLREDYMSIARHTLRFNDEFRYHRGVVESSSTLRYDAYIKKSLGDLYKAELFNPSDYDLRACNETFVNALKNKVPRRSVAMKKYFALWSLHSKLSFSTFLDAIDTSLMASRSKRISTSTVMLDTFLLGQVVIKPSVHRPKLGGMDYILECGHCGKDIFPVIDMHTLKRHGLNIIAWHLYSVYGQTSIATPVEIDGFLHDAEALDADNERVEACVDVSNHHQYLHLRRLQQEDLNNQHGA